MPTKGVHFRRETPRCGHEFFTIFDDSPRVSVTIRSRIERDDGVYQSLQRSSHGFAVKATGTGKTCENRVKKSKTSRRTDRKGDSDSRGFALFSSNGPRSYLTGSAQKSEEHRPGGASESQTG